MRNRGAAPTREPIPTIEDRRPIASIVGATDRSHQRSGRTRKDLAAGSREGARRLLNALAVYRPFVAAQLRLLFGPPRRSAGNATTNVSSLPIAMVHL